MRELFASGSLLDSKVGAIVGSAVVVLFVCRLESGLGSSVIGGLRSRGFRGS